MTVELKVEEFLKEGRIAEIRHVLSEVEFVPTGFQKPVRIKINRYAPSDETSYFYQTSHFPHTPLQNSPYISSDPWESTAAAAAMRAVGEMLSFLEEAKSRGHEPQDDWLVDNAFWR